MALRHGIALVAIRFITAPWTGLPLREIVGLAPLHAHTAIIQQAKGASLVRRINSEGIFTQYDYRQAPPISITLR